MKTQIVLFFVLLIAAMGCDKTTSSNEEALDPELLLSPFFGYTYTGDLPDSPRSSQKCDSYQNH